MQVHYALYDPYYILHDYPPTKELNPGNCNVTSPCWVNYSWRVCPGWVNFFFPVPLVFMDG